MPNVPIPRKALGFGLVLALVACGGSQRSSEDAFSDAVRVACSNYATQAKAVPRETGRSLAENARLETALFRVGDRWYVALRKLTPPASSGVSAEEWRRVIDAQRRDARTTDALLNKEFLVVERLLRKPHPKPKLPPGTGATAEILAQAFNYPEAQRLFRRLSKLGPVMEKDSREWKRIMGKTGVSKACGWATTSHGTTTSLIPPVSTTTTGG